MLVNLKPDTDEKVSPYTRQKKQSEFDISGIDLKGRVPPQNLDAEIGLLGSILLRPDVLHDITSFFRSQFFYSEKHKIIYDKMLELLDRREPIDLVTVATKLRETKELDSVGGVHYLTELSNSVTSSGSAEYFARDIFKRSMLRRMIKVSHTIGELAFNESDEVSHVIEKAEQAVYDLSQSNSDAKKPFTEIKDTIEDAWKRIEKMHEQSGVMRGVPTGFKDLDSLLSGFQGPDLIILAARPSVGKTSLALNFVSASAVKNKIPTAFFSMEMSKEQLVDRLVSAESRVDSWKLRTGNKLGDNDWAHLQEALNRLSAAPIFIDDEPAITSMAMRSKLRKMSTKAPGGKIGMVIVDYLQLMSSVKNYDSMVNQVTEISRALKGIAKEFNVPVLALSQLSRAVESRGGKPKLSDLRDSGSIEQDADIVMFIHREDRMKSVSERTEGPIEAEILIEKHRNGPTGMVRLHFDDKKTTFVSVDRQFGDFTGGGGMNDFNMNNFANIPPPPPPPPGSINEF